MNEKTKTELDEIISFRKTAKGVTTSHTMNSQLFDDMLPGLMKKFKRFSVEYNRDNAGEKQIEVTIPLNLKR